jgi:putative hydrolase
VTTGEELLEFSVNGRKFSVLTDLHTHTSWSHGSGSIEENVAAARARGLKKIGITDHGPGHVAFGIKRTDIPRMREEITALRERYPDIEILLGVEANIAEPSGMLDVRPEEFPLFDYVIAGIHYGALGRNAVAGAARALSNLVGSRSRSGGGKHLIRRNTAYVVKAVEQNPISFLTHPGENAPVDLLAVAVACAKRGTLIELNTGHESLTAEDLALMALTDVKFIITSDAHTPAHVGNFVASVRVALDAGLDLSRVVNLKVIG